MNLDPGSWLAWIIVGLRIVETAEKLEANRSSESQHERVPVRDHSGFHESLEVIAPGAFEVALRLGDRIGKRREAW